MKVYHNYCRSQESFKRLLMLEPKFSQAKEVNVRLGVMYKWKGEFAASLEVRNSLQSLLLYKISIKYILSGIMCHLLFWNLKIMIVVFMALKDRTT